MKSKEEIENIIPNAEYNLSYDYRDGFIDGYTQCQEDVMELLESEIRRAFIHGKSNGKMMEAGLERNETDDYTNWRMRILTKKD